jgi:hypothetical protein
VRHDAEIAVVFDLVRAGHYGLTLSDRYQR